MRDLITLGVRRLQAQELHEHEEQEDDDGQARVQEVLPGVPEPHAAQGGQGLGPQPAIRRAGSVALTARAPDSKSGGCRFESCLTRLLTNAMNASRIR